MAITTRVCNSTDAGAEIASLQIQINLLRDKVNEQEHAFQEFVKGHEEFVGKVAALCGRTLKEIKGGKDDKP